MRLLIDYETRSLVDLLKTGAWRYAADESTQVMACGYAWKINGAWSPRHLWVNVWGENPDALLRELTMRGIRVSSREHFVQAMNAADTVVAHNMEFERAVTACCVPEAKVDLTKWSCTMARAARLGLPLSLETLMVAVGGPDKDMEGNALIKRISKPRPTWKKKGTGPKWFEDVARLVRAYEYADSDIVSEIYADEALPELEPEEKVRWLQNVKENTDGLNIDLDLLAKCEWAVEIASKAVQERISAYTCNEVSNLGSPQQVTDWCAKYGTPIPNLQAATIEEFLTRELPEPVRVVLEAKAEVAKASVAKLKAVKVRVMGDGCVRDFQFYHGAHTGRNVGRGFQPLNLPRPGDVDVDVARLALLRQDLEAVTQAVAGFALKRQAGERAGVRSIKGPATSVSALDAVSACLRSLVVPKKGHKFVSSDYSGVEMVFTMTMAGQTDAMEKIRNREDMYCDLASTIYGFQVTKKDTEERQLGKQGVLGGGFGMTNPNTFQDTCANYGMYISEELAQSVIDAYAKKYPKVPQLWRGLNDAAVQAMNNPGKFFEFRDIVFHFDGVYWLTATTYNGSKIYYPGAHLVEQKRGKWKRQEIRYMRVFQKKWVTTKTYGGKLTENLVQKMCRLIMEEHKHELIRRGLKVAFTIYDEILFEVPEDKVEWAIQQINEVMNVPVPWFPDMPLRAEPEVFDFFRKGD